MQVWTDTWKIITIQRLLKKTDGSILIWMLNPTNHLYIFTGGIKGKIGIPLTFNLGVKY